MNRHDIEYLYRDPERTNNVALVTLEGISRVIVDLAYPDYYEVISGSGVFISTDYPNGDEPLRHVNLTPGDHFVVDRNRFYRFKGDLVMLRTSKTFREDWAFADFP